MTMEKVMNNNQLSKRFFQAQRNPFSWMNVEMKKLFESIVMLSLLILLAAPSTTWAEGECGQVDPNGEVSVSVCMDELLASQLNMIESVEDVVTEMDSMNLALFGAAPLALSSSEDDLMKKLQFLRDEHGRAVAADDAVEETDYDEAFSKADKVKGEKCTLSDINFYESLEIDNFIPPGLKSVDDNKFGNNKCDVFSATDLDDKSVKVNERKENMCEQVCDDKVNPNKDNPNGMGKKPRKKERKERVVGRLSDGIAAANSAAGMMSAAAANTYSLNRQLSITDFSSSVTDICESGFDVPALLEIIATGVSIANSVVGFTTALLETLKDNVEPAANQTVAGFNAGSAVIPFALVAGISKMAGEVVGGVEKGLTIAAQIVSAHTADTLQDCLTSVRDNTDDLKIKAGNTEDALARIEKELALLKSVVEQNQELLGQNQELLVTPQGKREGWNR
jgi:hypothetical protein